MVTRRPSFSHEAEGQDQRAQGEAERAPASRAEGSHHHGDGPRHPDRGDRTAAGEEAGNHVRQPCGSIPETGRLQTSAARSADHGRCRCHSPRAAAKRPVNAYLDASVLIRELVDQTPRLSEWNQLVIGVTSELARVECFRALERLHFERKATDDIMASAPERIEALFKRLEVLPIDSVVIKRACQPLPMVLGTLD